MTALEHALIYARRGWRVFPLHSIRDGRCTCSGARACKPGKHPRTDHGVDEATVDEEQIIAWWSRWPDANVASATGAESGLVVSDVDPRNGGDDSLCDLEARYGALPDTPVSLTGGGGTHYLLEHPGGTVPNRTALGGFAGIDLKGDGGYIVAPPSIHESGRRYAWNVHYHPDDVPLAPLPAFLLELALRGPLQSRAGYAHAEWDGKIPPRAARLLREDPRVRARFRRQPGEHPDRSPSGVDHSLAYLLARRGLTGAEIEAAIRASRAQAGLPSRSETYFAATVGKALGAVHA